MDPPSEESNSMSISVVRLGTPRGRNEGLRVGTVRRPPRGVKKSDIAKRDYYDVWLPVVAPSPALIALLKNSPHDAGWKRFARGYRAEMKRPEAAHVLDLLAALSHRTNLAVGCYCEDETHCHRSILKQLLVERGASVRQE
jgi:uncharacterized protein YeaO (DUF488 family)